jgi:glycosyltransferase involved in cell wall biosynthesis
MNLLFVVGVYPGFGGTEKVTTVIANELSRRGYGVHIVSFEQKNMELMDEVAEDVVFHPLTKPLNTTNNQVAIRQILIDGQVDIIINQWCLPYHVTYLLNRARRGLPCRLVSVLHGVPDRSKKVIVAEDALKNARNVVSRLLARIKVSALNYVIQRSIRLTYDRSDAYVVLSHGFIDSLKQYARLSHTEKLLSIGNPVTIPTDYTQTYTGRKKRQILYVGRMDKENKRVNRIVEAWEMVAPQHQNWNLVLVGDGPHRSALEDYVQSHHMERVTFTGFVKEAPIDYYKESSIFMLTSDLEGFGLVIVEAMSYGVVPIVYGSYVSVYDIIDSGRTGIITPMPYSQDATVAALCRLMDDEAYRKRMSVAAQRDSQRFELSSVVNQWEELFHSLL